MATARTEPTNADRTGTLLRPRPDANANRTPATPAADRPEAAATRLKSDDGATRDRSALRRRREPSAAARTVSAHRPTTNVAKPSASTVQSTATPPFGYTE